ncbi:hypothetical protein [Microcystis sp. LEGE 00066]|uniref:hypothetical protein n=1 Tax=Microcystis sp. LEGE 00066 TaxID=1828685 RepID=UPI00187F58EF|nr:hypothetical protein [Microcystis sp. LEGE 00066]
MATATSGGRSIDTDGNRVGFPWIDRGKNAWFVWVTALFLPKNDVTARMSADDNSAILILKKIQIKFSYLNRELV